MEYKEIKDIQIGDFVQGETGVNQVIDIEKPDLGSRLLYSLNDGPYFVTEEHPFKTEDGWKSINPKATYDEGVFDEIVTQLKEGDVIITLDGKEEIKSIKWESADNQTVYNLMLDGDNTYYADNYLVHNKSNRFVGSDTKWYSGIALRDGIIKPWNEMIDRMPVDAQESIEFLQRDFLGAFASGGDSDDENMEETGGGQLAEAQRAMDAAIQDHKNKSQEAKISQQTGFKDIGAQFSKQKTELTQMIGKTNLAGAAERQKKELQTESVAAAGDVTATKDIAMEGASAELAQATEEFDAEQANIKNNYEEGIRTIVKETENEMRDTKFRGDYDSEKGGLDNSSKLNSGSKVLSTYTDPANYDLKTINIDSVLASPTDSSAWTTDSNPIQSVRIRKDKGGGRSKAKGDYFKVIRKSRCCFVGSTKVLMGGANE